MAAHASCTTTVAIDLHDSQIALAEEIGATQPEVSLV
jgi:threonine dehydrogenase-like Zn-dependent dehydrogenase